MPNIPSVSATITINRSQVVNLLLASIAFEELGLAHIINTEAEKLQAALGTLPGTQLIATSISQLLSVNQSVNRTLQTVVKTQMLLQFKLEDVIELSSGLPPSPPTQPGPANITLVAGSTILAPGGATTLSGKVTDSMGNPLPNIQVIVAADAGTVFPSNVLTNGSGDYFTTFTAPGSAGGVVAFAVVAGTTIVGAENLIVA